MRALASATLVTEALVIGFVGLVAMRLGDIPAGTVWAVCGVAMALCVLLCGVITRPGAVGAGWAIQAGLVLSGFVVPVMFFLGAAFAVLWWASVRYGRKVDAIKAARAAG